MHVFQLHTLCQYYELGTPKSGLIDIAGGFQHQMAKLDTNRGSFAIKCLNPALVKQYGLEHFVANETFAFALTSRIPVCAALRQDAPILTLAKQHYLVYPWIEGSCLGKEALTLEHANTIGALLAKIHQYTNKPDHITWPKPVQIPDFHVWPQYKDWLKPSLLQITLNDSLPIINDLLAAYRMMQPMLSQQAWVYSHTDLTPANVIWQDKHAVIIDWEMAGPIMPGQDVLASALNWSLDDHGNIRWLLFNDFLSGYRANLTLPPVSKLSLIATLIDWLAWVSWNLEQVFDINLSDAVRERSAKQAEYSLLALQRTYTIRDELLACFL